jgi:5'-methylthioadenosine phosphorylase
MNNPTILLLTAVCLPPTALDLLGTLSEERLVRTPFGEVGPLALRIGPNDLALWVQPYSGLPNRTDPRATVYAARALGVRRILIWEQGIALNHMLHCGQTVIANDAVDATRHQPDTFAGAPGFEELRTPLELSTFCPQSTAILRETFPGAVQAIVVGVDGPRRETPAEASGFRAFGGDLLSTNIAPDVFLAREMGICFSALVTIDDYSRDQNQVTSDDDMQRGLEAAMGRLPEALQRLAAPPTCQCAQ